ncbi:MAG TPA: saccharopine dehydrogenase C-terminal domain-containing protein [Gammaproteobacteria bacterium]|nr:saccharopine dehydrogenase C-terminal domain-containing protein [Gammaproteobacteria bacterium]
MARKRGMTIGIVGAGKIGATIATLLESCTFCDAVALADVRAELKIGGLAKASATRLDAQQRTDLTAFIERCDAIVSAGPYLINREIVETCAQAGVAYFDLTEDVATTKLVRQLARESEGVTFVPQCGLAPGAINIVAGSLTASLATVRSVEMRVGALPQFASNQMKYYLSWSTAGLINEYCQLGEALHEGRPIATLPLDGVERLTIDGVEYEAFNTSGGVATMCETFAGKVGELNYKTLRYPGHRDLMKFLLQDLNLAHQRELLTQIFDQEVPLTQHDVVVFYVNAVGTSDGELVQRSYVKKIHGDNVEGRQLSAIQLTTAAGVVAVLELFARGALARSFVKQESITFEQFLSTRWGGRVYGGDREPAQR